MKSYLQGPMDFAIYIAATAIYRVGDLEAFYDRDSPDYLWGSSLQGMYTKSKSLES